MKQTMLASALAAVLLTACSKNNTNPSTAESEKPVYGSATDVAAGNGSQRNTNAMDAADNGIGGPAQAEAGNYENKPTAANPDQELAKQIKVAITTGSTGTTGVIAADQLTKINVEVKNGVVTLSGPVPSEADGRNIAAQVGDMKGVKSVVNNLTPGTEVLKQLK